MFPFFIYKLLIFMVDEGLIDYLAGFITKKRLNQFYRVLENRTRYITVILEDIYQSQNASAVLRSCECFGIQDVHVIENKNEFTINSEVSLGASKWIDLYRYNQEGWNTPVALNKLRENGYRIIATTPHTNDVLLDDFDVKAGKIALVFGTELTGISDYVKDNADGFLKIPMVGFTESFNISVSASIVLYQLTSRLRNSEINWQLSGDEHKALLLSWLKTSIRKSELIVNKYISNRGTQS